MDALLIENCFDLGLPEGTYPRGQGLIFLSKIIAQACLLLVLIGAGIVNLLVGMIYIDEL